MLEYIKGKVITFTEEIELNCMKNYWVVIYDKEMIVLTDPENKLKIYIINGKAYQEKIPIYPLFAIGEIKEALTQL